MTVISAIKNRRSYRGKYKPDSVSREDLTKIMEAGLAAPSGCNKQTTSLICVDDSEILRQIHAVIDPPIAKTAPALICVLTQRIPAYRDKCFAVQDYSAAIENMLLAIEELGYRSCWYEGHITDDDRICDKIADILNVPDGYELVCVLPVGIAEEEPVTPVKKDFEERAWFNPDRFSGDICGCSGRTFHKDRKGHTNMNYKVIDKEKYYRSGVFRHFTEDCKCSTSMTARIDVTDLVEHSRKTGTKFYINFLYLLSKVLNSRDDYKMGYLWQSEELICYDSINPIQYVFHEDTETCTPVYTTYYENYEVFYRNAVNDVENAKKTREYGLDMMNHLNWFDASYISWLSYDSLNVELPDGYLHFAPIVNWGKYREENKRLLMPVSVRLNHAIADGFLVANVYRLLEKEMAVFCAHE